MILAAALLVLVALGLFVWGIAAGATALYWACVAVSAVAAVLLVVAFLRMRQVATATEPARERPEREPPASASRALPAQPTDATAVVPEKGEPPHGADYPASGPGSSPAPAADGLPSGAASPAPPADAVGHDDEDPPVEEVEVTDLLLVLDLHDDVYVVDEHPRYHLADCPWLAGRTRVPLPVDEARTDGFTPCGRCAPDHGLAEVERGRRTARGAS